MALHHRNCFTIDPILSKATVAVDDVKTIGNFRMR